MRKEVKKVSLLIFSVSNTGGCERFTCGLANELNNRGYEVSIINIYRENNAFFPLEKGVKLRGVFKKPTAPSKYRFPFIQFRLLNLLKKKSERPDVLIGVGSDLILYALLSVRLLGIKFISLEQFNYHVNNDNFLFRLGKKLSALYAKALVVLTTKDLEVFKKELPVKGILACIPNFMAISSAEPSPLTSKLAIAIGRYTEQKGFDNLIKIWDDVARQHPDWELNIIGKGDDKPLLETLIQERNLQNNITLVPASKNVSEYYQQASLFLLSSRWEGLPLVMVEAKSFGLPIVSFDCETGPRDVIDNGADGVLVEDQNNDAFASAVNGLLNDRERLQKMGKQSLINSKQFAPETIVPKWERLFNEI